MLRLTYGVLLCLSACASIGDGPASAPSLAIRNANVVDVENGRIIADQTVLVSGADIQAVVPSNRVTIPAGTKIVDGRGKYLIPGLWDMHVHLFRHSPRSTNADTYFPLFVANGITGVRDMFTNFEDLPVLQSLRRHVDQGRPGPWVASAGLLVDGEDARWTGSIVAASPQQGRHVVREIKAKGGDFVKVLSKLSPNTYFAIADEARLQSVSFAGHVPDAVRVSEASNAGQKSIEHLNNVGRDCSRTDRDLDGWAEIRKQGRLPFTRQMLEEYDPERCRALFHQIARNGTWMVLDPIVHRASVIRDQKWRQSPNLKYVPAWIRETWSSGAAPAPSAPNAELAKQYARLQATIAAGLLAAGAPLLAGSDVGNPYLVPGFSLHENLQLLVRESGFSPLAALQTATINPARFLGLSSKLGSVAPGKRADLVLLEADPLKEVSNTQRIYAVVLNGRHFDRSELNELLQQAERAAIASSRPH